MPSLARLLALVAAGLLAVAPVSAALLKQMNLAELAGNADRIFSGTVIEIDKGTIEIGGGTLATVTYRILVDTAFRGAFLDKDGKKIADLRMVADPGPRRVGPVVGFPVLPKMPDIERGRRYLFFTTAESAAGLSTTVGLGQGCFLISGDRGEEHLANEFDNLGLFRGMRVAGAPERGPIGYADLSRRIQAIVGGQ